MRQGTRRTKEERLVAINEKIKKLDNDIKALEADKLQLETEIKAEKLEALQSIIDRIGKTPAEIIDILNKYESQSAAEE
jgi:flagellar basal body P-ring protein FlgI